MSANTEQRKLAAIMFTDMVGYSALAQRNEALALQLLEEHRSLLRALFPRFNGREVKTIGDAFLVEFHSALEAAQCAIEIQRTLAKRNHDVPAAKRIEVRIGIHIGDVVQRADGDVLGDGVNIASRIEPLAGANGICISVDVERQIRNTIEASLIKLGPTELKNIQVPMELFRIVLPWEKEGAARSADAHIRESSTPLKSARMWASALLAIIVLALAAVGLWSVHQRGNSPNQFANPLTNAPAPSARVAEDKSIAVLPFVNMSQDKADEYLSDGISEELITALSKITGLQVKARTSSFAFKGKNEDIQKIGEQLHVSHLLEGSVAKAGNKLRITAQLIKISDGNHLWSDIYDRDMQDIFAVRSEVAQQVVAALKLQLLPEEKSQLAKRPAENLEAYELYLQGRYAQGKLTEAALTNSLHYFEQAIQKQADFALAYAGLADSYRLLTPLYRAPLEVMPKAKENALKALQLDGTLSEAHTSLGMVHFFFDWDWANAEAEFKRALQLSPNNANAHHQYAVFLAVMKRPEEARSEIQKAQTLDPLSLEVSADFEWILFLDGRYDEMITQARRTLQREPNFATSHADLGMALAQKGAFKEALSELEKAHELDDSPTFALYLASGYAMAGKTAEAEKLLEEMKALAKRRYVCAYEIATGYALLGEKEHAFEWFGKGLAERCDCLVYPETEPFFQSLRGDPRFADLLRKVGLEK